MRKTTSRFWVDVVLFIALFGLVITGLIMTFFTDSGPYVKETSKYFLELHRHQWGGIHLYFAIAFTILILVHLILEWRWIKEKTKNLFKRAWMLVPIAGIAILFVFVSWVITPKTLDLYKNHGKKWNQQPRIIAEEKPFELKPERPCLRGKGETSDEKKLAKGLEIQRESIYISITGQDSLETIQEKTGISAKEIVNLLGLPEDISRTERLGILRRRYSFGIHDVREAVRRLSRYTSNE
ncbi:MAG: DUF4405 domain-containing protein [Candidatus Aminicenantes bacterium]|nr:DUF4405 domain-containing protein [Candidatus Aminicenantes bacterium]